MQVDQKRVICGGVLPGPRAQVSDQCAYALRAGRRARIRRYRANLVGAAMMSLTLTAPAIQRAAAETPCHIPDGLALRDISLPAAKQEVAADRRLIVLTFGGSHPSGIPDDGTNANARGRTYPGRLEAALNAALPEVQVTVANESPPGKISADVPPTLPGLIQKTGAKIVIWGPGGRDVAAHAGLEAFRNAVNQGIDAVRHSGADLILLDTTFVPSPARMASIEAYRERLIAAAEANHVPLLRRDGMMRRWSEDGTLNLSAQDPEERVIVAHRLFSCVAQSLAAAIAAAVR